MKGCDPSSVAGSSCLGFEAQRNTIVAGLGTWSTTLSVRSCCYCELAGSGGLNFDGCTGVRSRNCCCAAGVQESLENYWCTIGGRP